MIEKGPNPKALALFVLGLVLWYKRTKNPRFLQDAGELVQKLLRMGDVASSGVHRGWGYNFTWQARAFLAPRNTPNVIVTAFVVQALDRYAAVVGVDFSRTIQAAADALLDEHVIFESSDEACLSYLPHDLTRVQNANLWGATILSLAYRWTKIIRYKTMALKSIAYTCRRQRPDGSWPYGESGHHQFVDGFHTGYNLETIWLCARYLEDSRYDNVVETGMRYYVANFFLPDGAPKYYTDSVYPLDIHSCSQSIITLLRVMPNGNQEQLARKVMQWTMDHMRSSEGYFFYQRHRWYANRIPYIRWGQAWMFYALNYYLFKTDPSPECTIKSESISSVALSTH